MIIVSFGQIKTINFHFQLSAMQETGKIMTLVYHTALRSVWEEFMMVLKYKIVRLVLYKFRMAQVYKFMSAF